MEAGLSTLIGWTTAFVANALILSSFGLPPTLEQNFWITNIFTTISFLRGYAVRRLFNWLHVKGVLK